MEALRTEKETAEQPEREAKERHLKAWEGKLKADIISPSSCFPLFYISGELITDFVCAWLFGGQKVWPFADEYRDIAVTVESLQIIICLSDQKAAIRMEKDKARMAQTFLKLDEDADGL